MSQQPELTSTSLAPNPAPTPGLASAAAPISAPEAESGQTQAPALVPQRIPPWLVNAELYLRVFLLMFISMVIIIAPWSGDFARWSGDLLWFFPRTRYLWEQNALIQYFPAIARYSSNGAVRGVVSGLGLLNLWITLYGAFQHRDK
jgi:hypothetical protein